MASATDPPTAGSARSVRPEHGEDGERDPRADALDRGQQPEPVALHGIDETVEVDVVLTDMGFDGEGHGSADGGQRA